jgi:hypothetical protein
MNNCAGTCSTATLTAAFVVSLLALTAGHDTYSASASTSSSVENQPSSAARDDASAIEDEPSPLAQEDESAIEDQPSSVAQDDTIAIEDQSLSSAENDASAIEDQPSSTANNDARDNKNLPPSSIRGNPPIVSASNKMPQQEHAQRQTSTSTNSKVQKMDVQKCSNSKMCGRCARCNLIMGACMPLTCAKGKTCDAVTGMCVSIGPTILAYDWDYWNPSKSGR